ncbi:MAG: 50S ribosomal protein L17 [Spirochaetaceae bacterium]|nr:MAG: 50S ribosomal protein L17 [Spirochaetaceae bacterium]
MKNRIGFNRLSRRPAHRKALKRNMVTSLLLEERITTTQTKALEVRRMAEKMVTRAKEDSVHNRRMIGRDVKDKKALAKLFTEIGPRFKSRPGGYTRVLKLGPRQGDAAEMVLLEFVERSGSEQPEPKKKKSEAKQTDGKKPAVKSEASAEKKGAKAKAPAPVATEPVEKASKAADNAPEAAPMQGEQATEPVVEAPEASASQATPEAPADETEATKTE